MLRLPDGMRDRIREAAEEHGRSMNAEIVRRLEQSLSAGPGDLPEMARAYAKEMDDQIRKLQESRDQLDEVTAALKSKLPDTLWK